MSYGCEANNYDRKILVFQLAEHLLEVKSTLLKDENEESDSDGTLFVYDLPKTPQFTKH